MKASNIEVICNKQGMKIAVNTRFLLKERLEGIGRFSHETLMRLCVLHPEHQFLFFFDRPFSAEFIYADNVVPIVANPPARHPYLYYIWFDWSLPFLFKKYKPDIFLSPDGFLSKRSQVPSIPVIHDLAFEHYPQFVSKTGANYYRKNFPDFARRAERIATVSDFTKNDIAGRYNISPEKIDVVYNGASEIFKPLGENERRRVRIKYAQGQPYFVYVGALHPRKNIGNLLRSFDVFKRTDNKNFRLLVVGRQAWQTEDIREIYEQMDYKESVIFTGRVDDTELARITGAAYALLYLPFFEGFGLPLVEAFNCSIPVITSNVTSMPEVAGDAALLADPFSVEDITGKIMLLAQDEALYMGLCQKSLERSSLYTWERTAALLWSTVEKVAEKRGLT